MEQNKAPSISIYSNIHTHNVLLQVIKRNPSSLIAMLAVMNATDGDAAIGLPTLVAPSM